MAFQGVRDTIVVTVTFQMQTVRGSCSVGFLQIFLGLRQVMLELLVVFR